MYDIQIFLDTWGCFRDIVFSKNFSRQANAVFVAGKELLASLDEESVENDNTYKKIVLGTLIIAMAIEDNKFKGTSDFHDEYPDCTLPGLFLKIPNLKECYINRMEMLGFDASTLTHSSLKAIFLVGQKALSDTSLCQGNFREELLKDLKNIIPEDLSVPMFGHRAQYEEQKRLKKSEKVVFHSSNLHVMKSIHASPRVCSDELKQPIQVQEALQKNIHTCTSPLVRHNTEASPAVVKMSSLAIK